MKWEEHHRLKLENIEKDPLGANQHSIMIAGTNRSLTTVHFEHPSNVSANGGCYVLTTQDPYDLFGYYWVEAFSKAYKQRHTAKRLFFSMCYLRCVDNEGNGFADKILVGFLRTRCDNPRTDMVFYDNGKIAFVKGVKSMSNNFITDGLKKCWSVPEIEISDALRKQIFDLCHEEFTKQRWIYNPKYGVVITTHSPGSFDSKSSASTIVEMEQQARMTRGPLHNVVGRDILPSTRLHSPIELEMLNVQDKLVYVNADLESIKKRSADDQEQFETEIGKLKDNVRALERTLAKKTKAAPSLALSDDKAFVNLSQQVTQQGKQLVEQEKQLVAQKKLIQEKSRTESVPRSATDSQLFTHDESLKAVREENKRLVSNDRDNTLWIREMYEGELAKKEEKEKFHREAAEKQAEHKRKIDSAQVLSDMITNTGMNKNNLKMMKIMKSTFEGLF